MSIPTWRRGRVATVAGRSFRVRWQAPGRYLELDDHGVATGCSYRTDELDRLVRYSYEAELDGELVAVEDITDGVARVSTLHATKQLASDRQMIGNRYDGWFTTVPVEDLDDLHELVREVPLP